MTDLVELLLALAESVPISSGGPDVGLRLDVESLEVTLPIDARIGDEAALLASFPRGRWATGFNLERGQLVTRFTVRQSE